MQIEPDSVSGPCIRICNRDDLPSTRVHFSRSDQHSVTGGGIGTCLGKNGYCFFPQIIAVAQILLVTPQHKVLAMWFVVGVTAFGALLSGNIPITSTPVRAQSACCTLSSLTIVFIRPKLRRVEIDKQS